MTNFDVHIAAVRTFVTAVPRPNGLTFGCAAAERQFPHFVRCIPGQRLWAVSRVREALDAMWSWLRIGTVIPAGVSERLLEAVPPDVDGILSAAAVDIIGALHLLVQASANVDQDAPVFVAETSLNIVDGLLASISDVVVDSREWFSQPLFVAEMERQQADMNALRAALTGSLVDEVLMRSRGVSLSGEFWYASKDI